jgi:hypothetical protein
MTRVGARLGLHRKAMDVSPSLAAYLDRHENPEPIERVLQPGRMPPNPNHHRSKPKVEGFDEPDEDDADQVHRRRRCDRR